MGRKPRQDTLRRKGESLSDSKPSSHRAEVVRVHLEPHGNADSLSVAHLDGYTCVVRTADWREGDLAVYIPPDNLVDVRRQEFSFLAKDAKSDGLARIKAKRLRGVISFGLLIPAPPGAALGEDLSDALGIKHYEDEPRALQDKHGLFLGGEVAKGPSVYSVKYDLESGRKYGRVLFEQGESCVITEKIHGENSKYLFHDGKMFCSSHYQWKKEYADYSHVTVESLVSKVGEERAREIIEKLAAAPQKKNMWWVALDETPALRAFCEANPGVVVYGEVFGHKDLKYGHNKGSISFRAFDLMRDGHWVNWEESQELAAKHGLPWVPVIDEALPFDFDKVCELAEGQSLIEGANHVREGVVVKPRSERFDPRYGRVCLKWVGGGYLERSK